MADLSNFGHDDDHWYDFNTKLVQNLLDTSNSGEQMRLIPNKLWQVILDLNFSNITKHCDTWNPHWQQRIHLRPFNLCILKTLPLPRILSSSSSSDSASYRWSHEALLLQCTTTPGGNQSHFSQHPPAPYNATTSSSYCQRCHHHGHHHNYQHQHYHQHRTIHHHLEMV